MDKLKKTFKYNKIDDLICECLEYSEGFLNLEKNSIKYAIMDKVYFENNEPGLYLLDEKIIVLNDEFLKKSKKEDIRFLVFSLARNYYQAYVVENKLIFDDIFLNSFEEGLKGNFRFKEIIDKDSINFSKFIMNLFYKK